MHENGGGRCRCPKMPASSAQSSTARRCWRKSTKTETRNRKPVSCFVRHVKLVQFQRNPPRITANNYQIDRLYPCLISVSMVGGMSTSFCSITGIVVRHVMVLGVCWCVEARNLRFLREYDCTVHAGLHWFTEASVAKIARDWRVVEHGGCVLCSVRWALNADEAGQSLLSVVLVVVLCSSLSLRVS